MPSYAYIARTLSGKTIKGLQQAHSSALAVESLRAQGLYVVRIKQADEGLHIGSMELNPRVPLKELSLLCQQLSSILGAGMPLADALMIVATQAQHRILRDVLGDVHARVLTGQSLSQAFAVHAKRFAPIFLNLIEVGEASGTLSVCLARLHTYFKQEYTLWQKLRNAMIYPLIVGLLALGIIIYLLAGVIPMFEDVFAGAGALLPLPTRILIGISAFIRNYYPALLAALAGAGIGLYLYIHTRTGRIWLGQIKLRLPLFGQLQGKFMVARFTRTLGGMLAVGIPLSQALSVTSGSLGNAYVQEALGRVSAALQRGLPLHEALGGLGLFPPMVTHMVRIGEQTGTLAKMLEDTAAYYDNDTDNAIARLSSYLEPLIILVMGAFVLFVVMAILLPTYQLTSILGGVS